MDTSRYSLPPPDENTPQAWLNALNNAKAQIEHQNLR